ncbi:helix-turn-helix transcriptional regulator [Methylorubrum extorquens]|uniref:Regulatory protein MerR n=1 Tax=Methylorubrum extorquens DSM 13060 TaxID=882800 RepID=H1KGN6_METEX|nr:helix-turn-helix domain-containing protein [Methylorubrum extorquens]EHP93337.1 regulatory protein MerR [Methylorubrum extorquens DSM 13060]
MLDSMTNGDARPSSDRNVLSLTDACKAANLGNSTLRQLIREGRGPQVVRLSARRVGIRRCDLDAWIAGRMTGAVR